MRKFVVLGVVLAAAVAAVMLRTDRPAPESEGSQPAETVSPVPGRDGAPSAPQAEREAVEADGETEEAEPPRTEESRREVEEERLVDAFDGLTDRWMKPAKAGVTMTDVEAFAAAFRRIPKPRRDECIHRALNLIPDDNVMLLAGVLMDKGIERDIVETVFNDILNRDETVKKPILQQIFKDKSHPCWADVAWVLDVTGELPKTK